MVGKGRCASEVIFQILIFEVVLPFTLAPRQLASHFGVRQQEPCRFDMHWKRYKPGAHPGVQTTNGVYFIPWGWGAGVRVGAFNLRSLVMKNPGYAVAVAAVLGTFTLAPGAASAMPN